MSLIHHMGKKNLPAGRAFGLIYRKSGLRACADGRFLAAFKYFLEKRACPC